MKAAAAIQAALDCQRERDEFWLTFRLALHGTDPATLVGMLLRVNGRLR